MDMSRAERQSVLANGGVALGVPCWVFALAELGTTWFSALKGGLKVISMNTRRTAAVVAEVPVNVEGGFNVRVEGLDLFADALVRAATVADLEYSSFLSVRLVLAGFRSVELRFPCFEEEAPLRSLPGSRLGCDAHVLNDVVKHLRRIRGSDDVRVRFRVGGGFLVVEPPRRTAILEGVDADTKLELAAYFRDLRQVLEAFERAGFSPQWLGLSESVLILQSEYGRSRLTGLVAGLLE